MEKKCSKYKIYLHSFPLASCKHTQKTFQSDCSGGNPPVHNGQKKGERKKPSSSITTSSRLFQLFFSSALPTGSARFFRRVLDESFFSPTKLGKFFNRKDGFGIIYCQTSALLQKAVFSQFFLPSVWCFDFHHPLEAPHSVKFDIPDVLEIELPYSRCTQK